MPRTVPGSGASIFPVFNSIFGVREVYVTAGGSGYDPADPPRLRIENCGTPIRDAVLRPVIEGVSGEITAVGKIGAHTIAVGCHSIEIRVFSARLSPTIFIWIIHPHPNEWISSKSVIEGQVYNDCNPILMTNIY